MVHSRYPQPSMEPPPFGDGNNSGPLTRLRAAVHLQWSHRPSAMETWEVGPNGLTWACLQWSHRPSAMETRYGASEVFLKARLQWSHRPSAMETCCRRGPQTSRPAFNGATALRRWKHDRSPRRGTPPPAFNGAPPFGDGNLFCPFAMSPVGVPSMEPPPFGDGNPPATGRCRIRRRSFNGATALRRWKPAPAASAPNTWRTFNGATALRRWKPAPAASAPNTWRTFNGATALRRWKPRGRALHGHALRPSMEPPPFGDGNLRTCRAEKTPSMEPPPFGDGNLRTCRAEKTPSMEPPPFGDGNGRISPSWRSTCRPSMEPPPFGDGNRRHHQRITQLGAPSMEPPPFGDGNMAAADGFRMAVAPSMEPPPFGDGNYPVQWRLMVIPNALQWSHRPSAMETCQGLTKLHH